MSFGLHGFYQSMSSTLFMREAHHQHNTGSADSDGLASADITDLSWKLRTWNEQHLLAPCHLKACFIYDHRRATW